MTTPLLKTLGRAPTAQVLDVPARAGNEGCNVRGGAGQGCTICIPEGKVVGLGIWQRVGPGRAAGSEGGVVLGRSGRERL